MITTKSFRNVIKSLILSVVILSVSICSNAQSSQIIGTLKDTQGKAVTYASVVLKNKPGRIIGFGNSDDQGKYSILIPDTVHRISIIIEVNWLGYKKVQQQLIDGKNTYDFMLEEAIIELKEVQIKSRPYIKSKGDTLSYDVGSFSRREDRSIGDVIKHMPGLSVAENGQIAYNGKNITDLYIQGDDLMDGRYGLATRTITKEMIKSVDVMQHFQPVKVLKDKVFTNDVAINLVLKNENNLKLAGQAMLGGGLPQQYDVALNTMLFNKKIKMLNSLKGNNSGIDYQDEFNQYNLSDFLNSVDNNRPDALLSDATTGNPDIPRQNYYLNNSGVLNMNNLYNTRDSLQLKSNIQLFLDRSTFNYNSRVDNFLSTDTIHYKDLQNAIRRLFMLNTLS